MVGTTNLTIGFKTHIKIIVKVLRVPEKPSRRYKHESVRIDLNFERNEMRQCYSQTEEEIVDTRQ